MLRTILFFWVTFIISANAFASEAELHIPDFSSTAFDLFGFSVAGTSILFGGIIIALLGMLFGWYEFIRTKRLPAHSAMLDVSSLIYETCKTYLLQQGKLLIFLEVFIGACMVYYFYVLQGLALSRVFLIVLWSVIGILGSFSVAWFGMRINTYANSRTAFASLKGKPYPVMEIPLRSGMSIGVLLICVELIMMIFILLFVPGESAGACFIGFAIGESLGASVLRICGGIFTKIADIGSDLMKIVFNIKEDDARNPGVIADCTGDNAGDSVGPTADGFETYGVTGVALIAFLALALVLNPVVCGQLIIWIFVMRILMILTSLISYFLTDRVNQVLYSSEKEFN